MTDDTAFPRLVSLACHDLRTPLATVSGFAKTLTRSGALVAPADRYVAMIELAAGQIAELLDELGLVARIESGRYEPGLREIDTFELAQAAAVDLGEERVVVSGAGTAVEVDVEAMRRAVAALTQSALRHGGFEEVTVAVEGRDLRIAPVTEASRPVVLGEDLRDLGAAAAGILIRWVGGSLAVEDGTLVIRLPDSAPAAS
jgi:signal transduction histidine kinase